jgi:diacylglycerol kinase family enzyme
VGLPYHIGYYPGGSYNYLDASKELGLELSVNHKADYSALIELLRSGSASPLGEIK